MTFETVHIVRQYGVGRFNCTDNLNLHRKKRLFCGLPLNSTVRCDEFFFVDNPMVRCCAVCFYLFLWCGAVLIFFFLESCGAVRCCEVVLEAPHRTTP